MTSVPAAISGALPAPREALLAISFARSTAATYAPAVEAARLARWYREEGEGNGLVHVAVFGRAPEEAARAYCLIGYAGKWKSTQIYGAGQLLQNRYHVQTFLQCYLNASACSDPVAYCCYTYGGHLVPCWQLKTWFRYDPEHPSGGGAQLEAAAIRRGVNWCPMLQPGNFRRL